MHVRTLSLSPFRINARKNELLILLVPFSLFSFFQHLRHTGANDYITSANSLSLLFLVNTTISDLLNIVPSRYAASPSSRQHGTCEDLVMLLFDGNIVLRSLLFHHPEYIRMTTKPIK
jgi:hypothetical protein